MKIDLSLTITSIIALVALISPIITCVINNRYELKKQMLLNFANEKRQALNSFISCTLDYYGDMLTYQKMCNYTIAMNNLYLYFSPIDKALLEKLDQFRNDKNINKYKQTLNLIITDLSKQISKL